VDSQSRFCDEFGLHADMSIEELFRNRVNETHVAQVLQLVATLPNRRSEPTSGDISGKFDFWFDGGAGRIITGWVEYDLVDGTHVTVGTNPFLSVSIQFWNGSRVRIQQESTGSS
jgi:hypothetical protein